MRRITFASLAAMAAIFGFAGAVLAQVAIGFGDTPHDSEAPVEIVSDTLEVDQSSGTVIFTGNVIVLQGELRMAAAAVRVTYSDVEGDREVDEVFASGGVLMTRGTEAAEGAEARYDVASGLMRMTGNVLVTQGGTAIAGDRLIVDMETGNGTVEGRVRTVLNAGGSQ